MLEEAAEKSMMELAGGGCFAIGLRDGGLGEQRGEEQLEVGLGEAVDDGRELLPEDGNVVGGGGQHVHPVGFAGEGLAELLDLHLQAVVKTRDAAAGFDDVSALDVAGDARVRWVPDAAFELSGLIAEDEVEIGLVGLGAAGLLGEQEKEAVEDAAFFKTGEIGDIEILHAAGRLTHAGG